MSVGLVVFRRFFVYVSLVGFIFVLESRLHTAAQAGLEQVL